MQNQFFRVIAFGLMALFVQPTFAADKSKAKKPGKAAAEAVRRKAARNVETITAKLSLTGSQRAKVTVLLSESQWDAAVSAFKTARETEIHNQAHNIVRKTIPGMMRKFLAAGGGIGRARVRGVASADESALRAIRIEAVAVSDAHGSQPAARRTGHAAPAGQRVVRVVSQRHGHAVAIGENRMGLTNHQRK